MCAQHQKKAKACRSDVVGMEETDYPARGFKGVACTAHRESSSKLLHVCC